MELDLIEAVNQALKSSNALQAVRSIYARLQVEIDRRQPVCAASGRCCNFESYGHRLYVTTLELATFKQDLNGATLLETKPRSLNVLASPAIGPSCPLQIGGLCSVHSIRPFGCRIFFCDPMAEDWQQEQYELFHGELKQLHNKFEIPYLYLEWRAALNALKINTPG